MIGCVPARSGSKRIPGKNMRLFQGHPLLAYTLGAAKASGVFTRLVVSTEDAYTAAYVRSLGVDVIDRPADLATDTAADLGWLRHALGVVGFQPFQTWAILRPTSPFRTADTIRRAYRQFACDPTHDSLRAVEKVSQHPGKMWTWEGDGYPIRPLLDKKHADGTPWHSSPTQSLPPYYVQNACLDMGFTANLDIFGTIHGRKVIPFFTTGYEGLDLNEPADLREAEYLASTGQAVLPDPLVEAVPDDPWGV